MVTPRGRERGFTLMEIVVAMAVFGVFLMILVQLTADMTFYEKKYTVNFMAHPQAAAVVSRLRRDVADATPPYYPETVEAYSQTPKTLLLDIMEAGGVKHVVWDFRTKGEVHRISYNVAVPTEWVAHGTPEFVITDLPLQNKPDSVRILAKDEGGRLVIDQVFQPRPHE